ncbi:MAG: hypothetical protein LUG50_08065, partial [Planctomycetaceae bacterium]|nr:hypothetical protein [Planctomycetaceae bacterium]
MSVGTDVDKYGYNSSTVYQRQQAEKEAASSGKVSHQDFLKLLTTQLANQDPLSPMEDIDFTGQLAQLQALEEQIEMTKALKSMRLDTQLQAGTNMIGRYISGVDTDGEPATGLVSRVVQTADGVFAELSNKQRVLVADVTNLWNDANSMLNDVASSGNLVGMFVEAGTDANGKAIVGVVEKVIMNGGEVQLKLYGGKTVSMNDVTSLRAYNEGDILYTLPDELRVKAEEAYGVVGMTIKGKNSDGETVTGVVQGADVVGDKVVYTLFDGTTVDFDTVTEKPTVPTPEELEASLKGYWAKGMDEKGVTWEGNVVGVGKSDSGLYLILDDGSRVYLDVMEELRASEDDEKDRMIGKWVEGPDMDGEEASGVVTKMVEVNGHIGYELSNGKILLANSIT